LTVRPPLDTAQPPACLPSLIANYYNQRAAPNACLHWRKELGVARAAVRDGAAASMGAHPHPHPQQQQQESDDPTVAGVREPLLAGQRPRQPPPPPAADLGPRLLARAARLLSALRAGPAAALLLAAAAAEAAVVSRVGGVSGRCYQIFVDRRRDELAPAMAGFAALYAAAAVFFAAKAALREWLAVTWRARLARRAHALYCGAGGGGGGGRKGEHRGGPMAPPFYWIQVGTL
jgi:hypothetical protein